MKIIQKWEKHDSATSAVIGVVLMVVIAVAVAATVYVYINDITGASRSNPTLFSMNLMKNDDPKNCAIWIISSVEGPPIEDAKLNKTLLTPMGTGDVNPSIEFNDMNGDGYVNPGDTYAVTASMNDHFEFLITNPLGAIVYKSTSIQY